jgi:hypothetical protein
MSSAPKCDEGAPRQFWGKYRGTVLENFDPLGCGRIQVDVPALKGLGLSLEMSWAMPCVPYAGKQVGFAFTPPIGANIWVEFEGGDPTHPIWVGCFWTEGQRPVMANDPLIQVLKTQGLTLVINDTPAAGSVVLTVAEPSVEVPVTITIDAQGLQIQTAETLMSLSPEFISARLPPTSATITEEGVTVQTEGTVAVTAPETTVEGDVAITGAVEIEGDVAITGAVEIEGDVAITGAVEIEGDVEITGATEILGDLEVTGATEMIGDLDVIGAVEIVGDGALVGALEVAGDIAVAGAVEVGGVVMAALCEVTIP